MGGVEVGVTGTGALGWTELMIPTPAVLDVNIGVDLVCIGRVDIMFNRLSWFSPALLQEMKYCSWCCCMVVELPNDELTVVSLAIDEKRRELVTTIWCGLEELLEVSQLQTKFKPRQYPVKTAGWGIQFWTTVRTVIQVCQVRVSQTFGNCFVSDASSLFHGIRLWVRLIVAKKGSNWATSAATSELHQGTNRGSQHQSKDATRAMLLNSCDRETTKLIQRTATN